MGAPGTTPGPWVASAPDGSYHDVIRIFADADPEGASPVAVCPQRQSAIMSVLSGQNNDTTEAARNAHQIAASGALYDTLQEILDNRFFRQAHPALRVKARAALALARGEQS